MKKWLCLLPLFLSAVAQAQTVYMAGDSTMAIKEKSARPETGWGEPFAGCFDDSVTVDNRAKNGRSTRTFIEEGRWESIEEALVPGDFVIIQFGHNDDVESKESYTTPKQYQANLRRFVRETRARGGSPLLLTPVARRHFDESGKIKHTHRYPHLVRKVAAKEKVDFIDMEVITREHFQRLGDESSALRLMHIPPDTHPNYPKGVRDDTHFNPLGAREVAELVLRELERMNHPLAGKLRQGRCGHPLPATDLPRLENRDGNHALMVDGEPWLMLAAQVHNSSAWPAALSKVWPVVDEMHANTLQVPIAWEQVEPVEGEFDFSFLDQLLQEARDHQVRLVLLWFGTWKNSAPHYTPSWVKFDNERFPRMVGPKGELHFSLSPHARTTLEADKKAFVSLLTHLRDHDPPNTVIAVQVQNEPGTWGLSRDHSPQAERLFQADVPADIARALGRGKGNWEKLFGDDAAYYFHAWAMATYMDEIAAAGKEVKNLPMYTNAALPESPFGEDPPKAIVTGGPTPWVIDLWKATAQHLDWLSPDIYRRDDKIYLGFLDRYARDDNALFVAETGNDREYARYFFSSLGRGGIGFSVFGMDETGYSNYPLGARELDQDTIEEFARVYRLFHPMQREWAKLAYAGKVWGLVEPLDESHANQVATGDYVIKASYGRLQFGRRPPEGNAFPRGGVAVAQTGSNEFLVTGFDARVEFELADPQGRHLLFDRVDEGYFDTDGEWVFVRRWNGDQTDFGLNLTSAGHVLRVKLGWY